MYIFDSRGCTESENSRLCSTSEQLARGKTRPRINFTMAKVFYGDPSDLAFTAVAPARSEARREPVIFKRTVDGAV